MSINIHIPSHRGFMIKLFAECIFAPVLIPYHPWSYTCHNCLDWVVCAKLWFQRVIICLPTSTCIFVRIEFWLYYKTRKLFYIMVSIDKLTMNITDNHAASFRHSGHVYGNYNVRGHGNNIRVIKTKGWWSQWGELWWWWWWWWSSSSSSSYDDDDDDHMTMTTTTTTIAAKYKCYHYWSWYLL